jgi:seryl-tRNA synthetase
MLDIKFVRENADLVQKNSADKGYTVDVAATLALDTEYRALLTKTEAVRRDRNALADSLKSTKPTTEQIEQGKRLKAELSELEDALNSAEARFLAVFKQIPNMAASDVPYGATEDDNVVEKEVGAIPHFDFEVKNHWQIGEAKNWIDKERATKVAGAQIPTEYQAGAVQAARAAATARANAARHAASGPAAKAR